MESFKRLETLTTGVNYTMHIYQNYLIFGGLSDTIKIWDLGKLKKSQCSKNTIKICDPSPDECLKTLTGHNNYISSLCIYQD